jgi:hypothetical protein
MLLALALLPLLVVLAGEAVAGSPLAVRELGRTAVAFPDPPGRDPTPRVHQAYFDVGDVLRLSDVPVHATPTGGCDTDPPQRGPGGVVLRPRTTRMLAPRVDERRCTVTQADGRTATEITLLGLDHAGRVTWQRALGFRSGSHLIDQHLIGATRDGLVLSSLEVWSPETGEVLLPAPTRPAGSEARSVPRWAFAGSALFFPARREFLVFEADVTLTRRRGGLYRVRADADSRELILPVAAGLSGAYDRVEAMASLADGRHVALAQRREFRGPTPVSLAVLDLETRRLVFRAEHGKGSVCDDPTLAVGRDGHVGFAYRDQTARQHVLVHYRMLPDRPP